MDEFVQVLNLDELLQVQKVAPNGTINCCLDCRFVIYFIDPLPAHMPQPTTNKQPPPPIFAHVNHKCWTVGQGGQVGPPERPNKQATC